MNKDIEEIVKAEGFGFAVPSTATLLGWTVTFGVKDTEECTNNNGRIQSSLPLDPKYWTW